MATNKNQVAAEQSTALRYVIVGGLVVAAFFGAYRFAMAQSAAQQASQSAATAAIVGASAQNAAGVSQAAAGNGAAPGAGGSGAAAGGSCCGGGSASAGGGCCGGGGGSNATVPGKTTAAGSVQKVTIDLTTGSYSPNQIIAKAGVPIELDFKGPASGCNGTVVSQQLGFQQDVSNGGTIKIAALQPGTYTWTCGMGMYVGRIVVQ